MELGASFVCSVENTRWPVSAAWTAFSAVSRSRISPTMMMSGSCRRIVPQGGAEGDADRGLDADLVELVVHHLDGVLDGDHVHFGRRDRLERRVEGRGLAAARRPRDQDDAVRPGDEGAEKLVLPGREPDLFQVLEEDVRVEDPDHDLLAEGRRHGGDAQLHLAALVLGLDPAVLGPAASRRCPCARAS